MSPYSKGYTTTIKIARARAVADLASEAQIAWRNFDPYKAIEARPFDAIYGLMQGQLPLIKRDPEDNSAAEHTVRAMGGAYGGAAGGLIGAAAGVQAAKPFKGRSALLSAAIPGALSWFGAHQGGKHLSNLASLATQTGRENY